MLHRTKYKKEYTATDHDRAVKFARDFWGTFLPFLAILVLKALIL